MKVFLVTIKVEPTLSHDPRNKRTGQCLVFPAQTCTDVTGAHHTTIWHGESLEEASEYWRERIGYHVTRIEETDLYVP